MSNSLVVIFRIGGALSFVWKSEGTSKYHLVKSVTRINQMKYVTSVKVVPQEEYEKIGLPKTFNATEYLRKEEHEIRSA